MNSMRRCRSSDRKMMASTSSATLTSNGGALKPSMERRHPVRRSATLASASLNSKTVIASAPPQADGEGLVLGERGEVLRISPR